MLAFVAGGAASGKSAWAEALAVALGGKKCYLATMEPFGKEAQERIQKPVSYTHLDQPLDSVFGRIVRRFGGNGADAAVFRPGAQRDYPADRGNDDRIFLFGLSRAFGSFFGRQQHCRLYPLDDGKLRTDDLAENLCAGSGLLGAVCLVFSSGKKFERIAHGRGLCRDDGREHQGAEGCDYFDIRPFDCGSHRFCGPGVLYRDERTAYLPDDFKDRRFPGFNPVLYFMRRYFWRRV